MKFLHGNGIDSPTSTVSVHLIEAGNNGSNTITHGTLETPLSRLSTDGHRVEQWYQVSPTPEAGRNRPTLRLSLSIVCGPPIKGEKLYSVEIDTERKTKLGATIRVDSQGCVRIAHITPFIKEMVSSDVGKRNGSGRQR